MMTRGEWKAKTNKKLIANIRKTRENAESTVKIWWKWVKGHSQHEWNDRADAEADKGAEMWKGEGGGGKSNGEAREEDGWRRRRDGNKGDRESGHGTAEELEEGMQGGQVGEQ